MTVLDNDECIFCTTHNFKLIAQNEFCFAVFDNYPVSQGHSLIIPKAHVASYFELSLEQITAMHQLVCETKTYLDQKYHPDGYNVGINIGAAAGQSIFHVHMHIIPRYIGDLDNPRGGVRGVIPRKRNY